MPFVLIQISFLKLVDLKVLTLFQEMKTFRSSSKAPSERFMQS